MPAYIRVERVARAINALSDWRGSVRKQSTAHVLPLLALIEKGINKTAFRQFEEADDFGFFDRYCKVPVSSTEPYFDPFNRSFRIASHPHSNIATARKSTFANSWGAADQALGTNSETLWKLSPDYATIFAGKLSLGGTAAPKINVVDLAAWLFREQEFPTDADASHLRDRFLQVFPFEQADYEQLFEFISEPKEGIFQSEPVPQSDMAKAIENLALGPAEKVVRASIASPGAAYSTRGLKIKEDDPILEEIKALLQLGSSGVILRGTPGTGKSWYADQIALALTNLDEQKIFRVQFHPSYSYEDFVDGFVPSQEARSGFEVVGKTLRKAAELAGGTQGAVVLIVDEINRGNTAKIFGEVLTYIEAGWRGIEFLPRLSSRPLKIPSNLIILGTMNPFDRSITSLDMALLRRFDHVDIPPDSDRVTEFLLEASMPAAGIPLIAAWFDELQGLVPHGIGHTFFKGVGSASVLGMMWRYRVLPFCKSMLEFDEQRLTGLEDSYRALNERLRAAGC